MQKGMVLVQLMEEKGRILIGKGWEVSNYVRFNHGRIFNSKNVIFNYFFTLILFKMTLNKTTFKISVSLNTPFFSHLKFGSFNH